MFSSDYPRHPGYLNAGFVGGSAPNLVFDGVSGTDGFGFRHFFKISSAAAGKYLGLNV